MAFGGVVIVDVIYAFPQAYLLLFVALAVANSRPYEAAQMLGASKNTLAMVSFYGDSHSDIPIMKQAGQATVVNPENSMKEIALKQGWNTVVWKV